MIIKICKGAISVCNQFLLKLLSVVFVRKLFGPLKSVSEPFVNEISLLLDICNQRIKSSLGISLETIRSSLVVSSLCINCMTSKITQKSSRLVTSIRNKVIEGLTSLFWFVKGFINSSSELISSFLNHIIKGLFGIINQLFESSDVFIRMLKFVNIFVVIWVCGFLKDLGIASMVNIKSIKLINTCEFSLEIVVVAILVSLSCIS